MLIHANGLSALLDETELTSSDFATVKALAQGEINSFLGFKFIMLGDRDEGGLPLPSTRTNFAFHRDSVGLGVSIAQKTEINYVAEKRRSSSPQCSPLVQSLLTLKASSKLQRLNRRIDHGF